MQHTKRAARPFLLLLLLCAVAPRASAQAPAPAAPGPGPATEYTVEVKDTDARLFRVTAIVKGLRQPRLELSLPVWTPGWYTIENYAKNVLRFQVSDAAGRRLPHRMTRKQTWAVETAGLDEVRAEFDYRADVLALNQAKITRDFAFFTGTQLFLLPEGRRDHPAVVRFVAPAGWKILTALRETAAPDVFAAPDYDTLADAPTQLGRFDVTRFEVEGKPHYFASTPAGAFAAGKAERFAAMLAKVARAQGAIFGGLPYEKYVAFYFFTPPESNAGGAVEHANSYVAFAPPGNFATPEMIIPTAAHEFFHLWNVKRIRPAELWPYDYSRERETPLLWFSEGLTNYYTNVSLLRAGLRPPREFLQSVEGAINGVEGNEVRAWVSPADASVSTWLGYDTPVAFGISYYTQGQNIGALLDLSIRHETEGRASLDDVMRALYQDFYQKGRGFSTEDLIGVVNGLTKGDYADFFKRYVHGVEVPPYDRILGHAGYRVERGTRKVGVVGINDARRAAGGGFEVVRVEPDSPAAAAGVLPGDVVAQIDGADPLRFSADGAVGRTVKLSVRRAGALKTLDLKVGARDQTAYRVVELPRPTPAQLKVREGWLGARAARAAGRLVRHTLGG